MPLGPLPRCRLALMSAWWVWWGLAWAEPVELEPVWTTTTGPRRVLTTSAQGPVARTETGWVAVGRDPETPVDTTLLAWWDQVGPSGTVRFGDASVALLDGTEGRVVGHDGEERFTGIADVWVGGGRVVTVEPGRGWVGRQAGQTVWELAGDAALRPLDDHLGRRVARGVEVIDPEDGRIVDVVGLGDEGVGGWAGFAGCVVALPAVAGHPVRCWRDGRVVWSTGLRGAVFAADPVVGDLDGDGTDELIARSTGGRAFVLDAAGRWIGTGAVGSGTMLVADGVLVVGDGDRVVGWGLSTVPLDPDPPARPVAVARPVDPQVDGCLLGHDRSACLAVADRGVAGPLVADALRRACRLGDPDACERATQPALAMWSDVSTLEAACRGGRVAACERWVDRLPDGRRVRLRDQLCDAGLLTEGCGPAPTVEVAGRVLRAGQPAVDVAVRGVDGWVVPDRKGRFAVVARETVAVRAPDRSVFDVPVGDAAMIELGPTTVIRGRVVGDVDRFRLTGCSDRTVAVQADGRFLVPAAEPGVPCGVADKGLGIARDDDGWRVERIVPDVPAMVVRGPDGQPLADATLPFGTTGADGALTAVDGIPCADGAVAYEGYLAVCQLFRWPVHVVSDGSVVVAGGRTLVVDPGWTALEPGHWRLTAVDGGPTVDLEVRGPAAIVVPTDGRRALQVVDRAGWPVATTVETVAGPQQTDAWGRVPWPPVGPVVVDGIERGRPRDGVLVLDDMAEPAVRWVQRPLGLVATDVDELRVDLFPDDVLQTACGHDVRSLAPSELVRFVAGRACAVTVWRNGETVRLQLPVGAR